MSLMMLSMVFLQSSRAMASVKRINEVLDTKIDLTDEEATEKERIVTKDLMTRTLGSASWMPELSRSSFFCITVNLGNAVFKIRIIAAIRNGITSLRAMNVVIMTMPVMMLAMNITTLAVVWYGGNIIIAGQMQVGDLTAFTHALPQIFKGVLPHIHAVHQHAPSADVVKPGDQLHQGGLAASRGPDDAAGHQILCSGGF